MTTVIKSYLPSQVLQQYYSVCADETGQQESVDEDSHVVVVVVVAGIRDLDVRKVDWHISQEELAGRAKEGVGVAGELVGEVMGELVGEGREELVGEVREEPVGEAKGELGIEKVVLRVPDRAESFHNTVDVDAIVVGVAPAAVWPHAKHEPAGPNTPALPCCTP